MSDSHRLSAELHHNWFKPLNLTSWPYLWWGICSGFWGNFYCKNVENDMDLCALSCTKIWSGGLISCIVFSSSVMMWSGAAMWWNCLPLDCWMEGKYTLIHAHMDKRQGKMPDYLSNDSSSLIKNTQTNPWCLTVLILQVKIYKGNFLWLLEVYKLKSNSTKLCK